MAEGNDEHQENRPASGKKSKLEKLAYLQQRLADVQKLYFRVRRCERRLGRARRMRQITAFYYALEMEEIHRQYKELASFSIMLRCQYDLAKLDM